MRWRTLFPHLGPQPQVLAAERDDLRCGRVARRPGQQVGLQARADHQPGHRLRPIRGDHLNAVAVTAHRGDRGTGQHLAAGLGHVRGVGAGDGREVDDGRGGGQQRGHARDVGLERADVRPVQPAHPGYAVSLRPALDLAQPLRLHFVPGHHQLAALVPRQAAVGAVGAQQLDAAPAVPGLGRARLIVDPGVGDTGVVPGLVLRDRGLLLPDGHCDAGGRQLARGGQPDQPSSNDPHLQHVSPQRCGFGTSVEP